MLPSTRLLISSMYTIESTMCIRIQYFRHSLQFCLCREHRLHSRRKILNADRKWLLAFLYVFCRQFNFCTSISFFIRYNHFLYAVILDFQTFVPSTTRRHFPKFGFFPRSQFVLQSIVQCIFHRTFRGNPHILDHIGSLTFRSRLAWVTLWFPQSIRLDVIFR